MRIDIHNYEEFVLDFLDGNMKGQQAEEMKAFLLMHPDIAEDLEGLDEVVLEAENQSLLQDEFVSQLKKTEIKTVAAINEDNYEEVLIAELEHDLDLKQEHNLKKFVLLNPQLKQEQNLIQNLKLTADSSIIFNNKSSLKKKNRAVVALWTITSSVAAALLISFWLFNLPSSNTLLPHFEPLQSIEMASLNIEHNAIKLQIKTEEFIISSLPVEIEQQFLRSLFESTTSLTSVKSYIAVEDQRWKNEMTLLQAYAFDKNELDTQIDLANFPATNKSGPIKLISSMLWKTTKASVKSLSDELISEDVKLFSSQNIGDFTGGMFQIKRPTKEVE